MNTALAPIKVAEIALLDPKVGAGDAANYLLALPVPQRCLAIAGRFGDAVSAVPAKEMSVAAERFGRRVEAVLEQLKDKERTATLRHLIEDGDSAVVFSMIRGRAGDISSTTEILTEELVERIYEQDPDMNNPDKKTARVIYLSWTLVIENSKPETVARFFLSGSHIAGKVRQLLERLANRGDEEASRILNRLFELEAQLQEAREIGA